MPSRQDQLHSYQFMVQRVVAALVMRETDPAQSPFRRAAGASLAERAGRGDRAGRVRGVRRDRRRRRHSWRDASAVIVERESGARYVYRDEKLHLVLNYASALLIIGAAQPKTVLVSRRSIEGVPRGSTLGIAEAPDSLPAAGAAARSTVDGLLDRGGRTGHRRPCWSGARGRGRRRARRPRDAGRPPGRRRCT